MICGTVYWITGLPGSGKTTLAKLFHRHLQTHSPSALLLDGDTLREILGETASFQPEDRLRLAFIYSRLCKCLSEQGSDVVIATVSMFHACRAWNRAHLRNYREIYLRTPLNILRARDQKGLYSRQELALTAFEEPEAPDYTLEGTGAPEELALNLWRHCHARHEG